MQGYLTSHRAEPAAAPLRSQTQPPHRVLAVDEDTDLRLRYADALAGPGFHVDVVLEIGPANPHPSA